MKASLRFAACSREGKTFLHQSYATPPFKLADITEDKRRQVLSLMIMSSSPGILDGDQYHLSISLAENSSVELQTQSYQRLFTMKDGATQQVELCMANNSACCFISHPVVPHQFSIFKNKNRIQLNSGCSLLWGEILTCGRKMNGEIFQFTSYHNITEIYKHDKLVVKENLFVQPSAKDPLGLGQMEGFTHQASLLFLNESIPMEEVINRIRLMLTEEQGIEFGISSLAVEGFVIRILAQKAEQLFNLLKQLSLVIPWQVHGNCNQQAALKKFYAE